MMGDFLLTLNAGSSSLKFALFEAGDKAPRRRLQGQIEAIGVDARMTAMDPGGVPLTTPPLPHDADHEAVLGPVLNWIDAQLGGARLAAVGHRIVHGGPSFDRPVVIDEAVLAQLDTLCDLAPLHQPHNLAAVRAVAAARPGLMQVGCFDTAFHHGLAEVVTRFALPRRWHDAGVRRYGFHGISYAFVARRLRELDPDLAKGRVVVAHLGNGASLCAIHDGRSVDTTMGFTALDGLVMGTRCGAIDPGVVLYLLGQGMSPEAVQTLLYEQSGLLGVSHLSGDMRLLLASDDAKARQAIELFTFRAGKEASALASSMGGIDGLVFTAGIGEHAPQIRAQIAERLVWLGLVLDPDANASGAGVISTPSSRIKVWVIPTDEEIMIARHVVEVMDQGQTS